MGKTTNNTGEFELNKSALIASLKRYDEGSDDEVDPLEPDLVSTDADTIHTLITEAIWSGAVTCPGSREIFVYPSSREEPHVCVITVWDGTPDGKSHVVAASLDVKELANHDLWEGEDRHGSTVEVVEQLVAIANSVREEMDAIDEVVRQRAARRK